MGMSSESRETYDPSYRQVDVDNTLENHEARISRLEKISYVGAGYIAARAPEIITQLSDFVL